MVDLGVGGGGVRTVLAHEAVDEAAGGPAGEGAGELGVGEDGVGDGALVEGVGTGLGADEEGGAELGGVGADGEDGGDLVAAHEAAGGDDRELHGVADLGDEGEQADARAVQLGVVAVGALVAAGLYALDADGVGTRALRGERFGGGGDGDDREGADAREGVQRVPVRAAEGEADHRDGVVEQDRDLGLVRVVVAGVRIAERGVVPGGLAGQLLGVDLDGGGIGGDGLGHEEVHAEGVRGEAADLLDLLVHRLGRLVPGGEEAEAAGLADSGGQARCRPAAGHGGLDDGVREEVGQRSHEAIVS